MDLLLVCKTPPDFGCLLNYSVDWLQRSEWHGFLNHVADNILFRFLLVVQIINNSCQMRLQSKYSTLFSWSRSRRGRSVSLCIFLVVYFSFSSTILSFSPHLNGLVPSALKSCRTAFSLRQWSPFLMMFSHFCWSIPLNVPLQFTIYQFTKDVYLSLFVCEVTSWWDCNPVAACQYFLSFSWNIQFRKWTN